MPKITNDHFYPNVITPTVSDELVCLQDDRVKKLALGDALLLTTSRGAWNNTDTAIYLTSADLNGHLVVDNDDLVEVLLPPGDDEEDMWKFIEVHVLGLGGVSLLAAGLDVINDSSAGGAISSKVGQRYAVVRLRLIAPGRWALAYIIGTWRTT